MRRQALRQAAALARELVDAAGPCRHGAFSEAFQGSEARVAALSGWAASGCTARRSMCVAATEQQPWLRLGPQRGAAILPMLDSSLQQTLIPLRPGTAPSYACCRRSQLQQQQRRAVSAQAEPAEAASSSSSSSLEGLTLSDSAVERLKELQAESSGPLLLRVTVEGGGCSGFQYEFSIEEGAAAGQLGETDRLFERDGVRLVCDDISLEFLKGATVDFESDLMRSAFVVQNNPNAASSCGCGSSFVAK